MAHPFEPNRFKTAAHHYVRGRLDYPADLIGRVCALTGLRSQDRVLDLGCGPGFLAASFAPRVQEVVAIDPEPAMLEAAREYLRERGASVSLRQGSSFDLGPDLGIFHLAVMGRSFHWMDGKATLVKLAEMTDEGGAVALFGDTHLETPENGWWEQFKAVLDTYMERDPGSHRRQRKDPAWRPHAAVLLDSPFGRVERMTVVKRIETPVERLIDRALSLSSTSPEKLGADLDPVVAALRRLLAEEVPSGVAVELVEFEALLGFKS